jgi:type IV secretion system protein TrbL
MTGGCDDFICDVVGGVGNVVDGIGGAIGFAQDPFGAIFRTLRDAASGLARDVLPAITDATLPDLSLGWFVQAYAISFAAALLVGIVLVIVQLVKVARGTLAGRDLVDTLGIYFPMFLIGAMFGPLFGIILVNFFHAVSNDVIAWGVEGSTEELTSRFTAMIETTDPAALTGGVVIACLLMLAMVLGLLLVLGMLIVQLVTLYFTGILVPLGLVWIIDRDRRQFGMKLLQLWVGILAAHPLLFFLLGVTFNLVAGSVTGFGENPPLQSLVTLCVAILSLFVAALSPMLLLRFAPIVPTGTGGTSGPTLGRGDSYGSKSLADADRRYASMPSSRSGAWGLPSGEATATGEPATVGATSLSAAAATRAGAAGATGAATGAAEGAGAAEGVAAAGATAGAAETATGAGAAIGIPTLIAAGAVAVTSKAVDIGNQAVDQAVAPMDGSN